MPRPTLYISQILAWADEHDLRTGAWPGRYSGPVFGTLDEKWMNIDQCLRDGLRGLHRLFRGAPANGASRSPQPQPTADLDSRPGVALGRRVPAADRGVAAAQLRPHPGGPRGNLVRDRYGPVEGATRSSKELGQTTEQAPTNPPSSSPLASPFRG